MVDKPLAAVKKGPSRRYPGVASFCDDAIDRSLFFGRRRASYDLLHLVLAERLVVLLARSGIGKSSLINAGLMQPLREAGCFPMVVRVNSIDDEPLAALYDGVQEASERGVAARVIDSYEPNDPAKWNRRSLWQFMKTFCLWRGAELVQPVLIIDQFEELFTLISEKSRKRFVDELADVVRGRRRRTASATIDDIEGGLSDRPPEVKVLLSIREDFLVRLDEMAERLPSILKTRFRLGPLQLEDARLAITKPAQLRDLAIRTRPFEWAEDAVNCVLTFLRQRRSGLQRAQLSNEVEPFQLQLVCQHVEDLVAEGRLETIRTAHLGGERAEVTLRAILTRFYEQCLTAVRREFQPLHPRRLPLERLCEQEFISEGGRRRFCEESSITRNYRVPAEVLAALVAHRLIRKEERLGDSYYELAHDTLIGPILESRQRRSGKRRWRRGLVVAACMFGVVVIQDWGYIVQRRVDLINEQEVLAAVGVRAAIAVGGRIEGRLRFFERVRSGVVLDAFEVAVNGRVTTRIDVSSAELDSYLMVRTANGKVLWDDDSGEGFLDASLTVSAEGPLRVIVSSYEGNATGEYVLSITEIAANQVREHDRRRLEFASGVVSGAPSVGELTVGVNVARVLGEEFRGWTMDTWVMQLDEAQWVRIELSSGDFDPYLVVETPIGELVVDDDSGGSLNASLELPTSVPGTVRIIVTSYSGSDTGEYQLSVRGRD